MRPALLPRLLPPREREKVAGVEAPERDLREELDLVRWWVGSSGQMRLVELSRLESQLWPFSSRVEEARAIPARSIHSASVLGLFASGRRLWLMLGCLLGVSGAWWRGRVRSLCRAVSLNGAARLELLLRAWRLRELLREWERMGGVLGTETLDR